MRALIQRVTEASVTVDNQIVGQIGSGFLVLVCAMQGDTEKNAQMLADKVRKLRIFSDDAGRMNKSLEDTGGAVLVVSQFTLAADTSSGNRPGFSTAAPPEIGKMLYKTFSKLLSDDGIPVQNGVFGADMAVALVNDGPITIWVER